MSTLSEIDLTGRILEELYSAAPPEEVIPLVDPSIPSFEPEPTLQAIESVFSDIGLTPFPSGDYKRRAYGHRLSGEPTEFVIVDWSDNPDEIRPLEHISGPAQLRNRSFAYVRGVPNGLVSSDPIFSKVAAHSGQSGPLINKKQVFLPLFDPVTEMEGWQFGFPPAENGLLDTDLSILLLNREGETFSVPYPILESKSGRPPEPIWAWPPVSTPRGTIHARLSAPSSERAPDARVGPLTELSCDRIYTPMGTDKHGNIEYPARLPWDLSVPDVPDGIYQISLGPVNIATAVVSR